MDQQAHTEPTKTLAELRHELAAARFCYNQKLRLAMQHDETVRATSEWIEWDAARTRATAAMALVTTAEDALRAKALEAYAADPSTKQVAPGVTIAVRKTYRYDTEAAILWAEQNAPTLLQRVLDVAGFTKVGPILGGPIEIVEIPSVRLTTDPDLLDKE